MRTAPWPLVVPNDDGIRPAGAPDTCFYCGAKIGSPHGPNCVVVVQRVALGVEVFFSDGTVATGVWELDEPAGWTAADIEFHKNESSWCLDNFLAAETAATEASGPAAGKKGHVTWNSGPATWERVRALAEERSAAGGCLCGGRAGGCLRFTFLSVVDSTPRRAVREPPS